MQAPAPGFRADTALPAGYYSTAAGKTGAALLAALDRIVCRARVLGYDAARDSMYARVEDPDNDDLLADVYTPVFPSMRRCRFERPPGGGKRFSDGKHGSQKGLGS